jgi:hypothetical protein
MDGSGLRRTTAGLLRSAARDPYLLGKDFPASGQPPPRPGHCRRGVSR